MRNAQAGADRDMVTPEGIPLRLTVARAGDRAGAFVFDVMIQAVLLIVIIIAAMWIGTGGEWALAFALLMFFLIRTFFFIWFETRWQGRTPGKKRIGIRVMDAAGGPLRTDAIIVRNLMREIEVWVPLFYILSPDSIWPDAPSGIRVLFMVWGLVFLLMPLFNRDRLRVGDMVAGTLVVYSPKVSLLPDLGGEETRRRPRAGDAGVYRFTQAQLEVYGIYELQTLEDLLRRKDRGAAKAFDVVCRQIRKKIRWPKRGRVQSKRFLREFYTALRSHLEHKMLLGKRKADKYSKE